MLSAARCLVHDDLEKVSRLSKEYPGYELRIMGHSLGGGIASLVTHMLATE